MFKFFKNVVSEFGRVGGFDPAEREGDYLSGSDKIFARVPKPEVAPVPPKPKVKPKATVEPLPAVTAPLPVVVPVAAVDSAMESVWPAGPTPSTEPTLAAYLLRMRREHVDQVFQNTILDGSVFDSYKVPASDPPF